MTKQIKTFFYLSALTALLFIPISYDNFANADQQNTVFTPVVVTVLNAPDPVKGSDGMYHLVYELEALNATGLAWTIDSVQVLGDGKSIAVINGEELDNRIELIKDRSPSTTIQPGESAVIFVHVPLDEGNVPVNLSHRVTLSVPNGIPEGFKNFAGIPVESEVYTYMTGITPVGSSDAIVISPPLEGNDWIAADGCCDSTRHIRAMMPINDRLHVAQRFAIDWETINKEKRIFAGDSKDVNSYFAYGKNVLAVADAKVVAAVDKYNDQVPGGLPGGMTLEEADGNHIVLDLGGGKYALYAHLKPGSVKVSEGDTVKRGQVMAQVGNTGNTTAPHLHFHVMDGPSTLGSNGLPYVIDSFEVTGRVPSTEAFDKAEAEGTPLEIIVVDQVGTHEDELPLDQRVVNFPAGSNE